MTCPSEQCPRREGSCRVFLEGLPPTESARPYSTFELKQGMRMFGDHNPCDVAHRISRKEFGSLLISGKWVFQCVGVIEEAHMVGGTAVLLILFAALYFGIRGISRLSRGLGSRLVTCPETKQPTIVEVAAGANRTEGFPVLDRFRIRECSRWPFRRDCGRGCLRQIEARLAN